MIKLINIPIAGMDLSKITGRSLYGMRTHPTKGTYGMHDGVDYGIKQGASVLATADGKVLVSKMQDDRKGWGNYIVIRHKGFDTLHAHLSKRNVRTNQLIKAGQKIGEVGSTGNSTGPHLHFSIYDDFRASKRVSHDPLPILKAIKNGGHIMEKVKMLLDGKVKEVQAVNVDGNHYARLWDLTDVVNVSYDKARKMPKLDKKK